MDTSLDKRLDRNVMLRLKNKVEGPSEVLDSTAHGPRFQNSKDVRGEPISSEADLTTALIKRLRDLETEMKSRNAVIQQLHIDKEKLEDKVHDLQERIASGAAAEPPGAAPEQCTGSSMDGAHIAALDSLRSENGRLRRELDLAWRQVKDMKRFLNDYGMVWVGEDDPSRYIEIEDAAAHIPKEAAKDPRARALKEDPDKERLTVESMGIDPKAVEQHVERLNTNAGPSDPAVPLTIFRDGIQLHVFPFTPFSEPSSRALLRDIADGYHPYQLREDFPNGVRLVLIDKSTLNFGPDAAARSAPKADGARPLGNIRGLADIGKDHPQTKEEYLKRLPQTIIKNGKVVSVRQGIEDLFSGKARPPLPNPKQKREGGGFDAMMDTPAINQLLGGRRAVRQSGSSRLLSAGGGDQAFALPGAPSTSAGPSSAPVSLQASARQSEDAVASEGDSAMIQVKAPDGQVLVLKMGASATIGSLHARISRQLGTTAFEIRSAFPHRAYTDMSETLEAAGMVPSATLFIRMQG